MTTRKKKTENTETDGQFEEPAVESENPAPADAGEANQAMPEQGSKGRLPDIRLRSQNGGRWTTHGFGWVNADGSVSIALNGVPVPTNGSYRLVAFRIQRDENGNELRVDRQTGEVTVLQPRTQAA